jgi:hypothetical protein
MLDRLVGLPGNLIVEAGDNYWKDGMERTRQRLEEFGIQVRMEVVPRNGHFLPDMTYEKSGRIFDYYRDSLITTGMPSDAVRGT